MGYRYLSTSRGVGNVFPFIFPFPIKQYSSLSTSRGAGNHPRKPSSPKKTFIPTYLPREGPETLIADFLSLASFYRYLSTSRGAGNLSARSPANCEWRFSISTYLPREGPETRRHKMQARSYRQYSYLSTSRGDGNLVQLVLLVFQQPYSYLSTSRGAGNL